MILLDDVVQVFALPQHSPSSDYAFLFELIDGHRILDHKFGTLIVFVLVTSLGFEWPAKGVNILLADVKAIDVHRCGREFATCSNRGPSPDGMSSVGLY
jgi:hypothetical protein